MEFKLYTVRVFVADFEQALRFYTETVGIPLRFADVEMGWAELETGGASIALEWLPPEDPEADTLIGRFVGASLVVEDIEALYQALLAHGVSLEPPEQQPWGGRLLHVKDPDGNTLTFFS